MAWSQGGLYCRRTWQQKRHAELEDSVLKIYGYAGSINVRKVLWMCAELELPFAREDWGGGFRSTLEPRFRALNPVGMVPVIDDGGVIVWESNVIVRYLAMSRGRTDLAPADPASRAHVEQWMDWQASDFNNSWRVAFQGLVRRNSAFQDQAVIEASGNLFSSMVGIVDAQLGSTDAYIVGKTFTVADIVIGLSLHRWHSIPMIRPHYPNVERYYKQLLERDGFRRYGRDGGP
jgi:glutathione S-transferase